MRDVAMAGGHSGQSEAPGDHVDHVTAVVHLGEVQHQVGGSPGVYHGVQQAADFNGEHS